MAVVRHARVSERADEDSVEGPEGVVTVWWDRDTCAQVVVGTPRQRLEPTSADFVKDLECLGHDLRPDAVAWDDSDVVRHAGILRRYNH